MALQSWLRAGRTVILRSWGGGLLRLPSRSLTVAFAEVLGQHGLQLVRCDRYRKWDLRLREDLRWVFLLVCVLL